jgi:tRNA-Thr(GGU) m(6)t(6)A37 methyltransferase TsaA
MSSSSSATKLVAVTAVVSSLTTALVSYWWHQRTLRSQSSVWNSRRQEERTGRIRAEVKVRTTLKEMQRLRLSSSSDTNGNGGDAVMVMRAIGTVVSPYTKRMGTPRQPQLVPSSRGYIEFHKHIAAASLSGIEEYSHIWVLFEFHANTDLGKDRGGKSKIRPPRGGGVKVGQLATRSPHRPNPVGLSLIQVERWDEAGKRLYISGLDLVHGTPVYDIKPCVPWDIPGGYLDSNKDRSADLMKVPSWVSQKDAITNVKFSEEAVRQLQAFVTEGRLTPLYTDENDGFEGAMQTLKEVLAQDPRSSHKGLKENARGTAASNNSDKTSNGYRVIFGQCQVEFVVLEEQGVLVTELSPVDFDPNSYVDGIPLISESNLCA